MPTLDPKPIIVFVHGAWQDTSCFDIIRAQLSTYNYSSTAVPLPSTGASSPSQQTHLEDVIAIRNTLEQLVLVGEKDVLLVLHSYGGIPGCGAIEGLEKSVRKSIGGRGGVIGCVFIAAMLPLKGQSLSDVLKDWKFPYLIVEGDFLKLASPEYHFYNDLSPAMATHYSSKIRDQSKFSFASKAESVPWDLTLPLTYMVCNNDRVLAMDIQHAMIDRVGRTRFTVTRCASGHFPFLSRPEAVVEVLRFAAGENDEYLRSKDPVGFSEIDPIYPGHYVQGQ